MKCSSKTNIALAIVLLALSACTTSVPKAENFPQSSQKKALVAQHWSLIAQDAAGRTQQALAKEGFAANTPIYIGESGKHDFDKAFKKYMISHLVAAGAVVSTVPEGAIEVKYESQIIRHKDHVVPEAMGYKPGLATAGVAGFWILRDVFKGRHRVADPALLTAGVGIDAYQATHPGETPVELILTTAITHNNRYVMLNADAYYIEKGEEWLFEGCNNRRRCK